ncbi:hypothetical protein [Pedobacter namyangjuensis]|uniref:hypothetical protein n=1 Tax=Pedobacter namyangjuensis TaxID=600626 RepID=UPI000DE4C5A6|nr:hypothetical protein [Pedobacter namyangjuensis]
MPRKVKKTKTNTRKQRKNKLGVKNSLVNNINARKRKGKSRSKKKRTISKKAYSQLKNNWGKKKD